MLKYHLSKKLNNLVVISGWIASQPRNKKIKLLKKELLEFFKHSGFKYELWSHVPLVYTVTLPLTSPECLGKPYFTSLHNAIETSVYLMELQKN